MSGLLKSRYEAESTSDAWRRCEGRTVAGKFPLKRYLGGSGDTAVFLTLMSGAGSKEAAIRLMSTDDAKAEKQLRQWRAASELTHSNLIRIHEAGRSDLNGAELIYVVEEYAEENLSQVLPDRALTPEETRQMLPPVLRALQFLHDKGLVHGRIQPSNILAIGDQVKLSSDTVGLPGEIDGNARMTSSYRAPESAAGTISAPADVWQLGVTLVEVMTRQLPRFDLQQNKQVSLPDGIPQPFREIVENCLHVDPAKRWNVTQIADCLQDRQLDGRLGPVVVAAAPTVAMPAPLAGAMPGKGSAKWLYAMPFVMAIAIVIFLLARPKTSPPALPSAVGVQSNETQSKQAQPVITPENTQAAQTSTPVEPTPNSSSALDAKVGGVATAGGAGAGSEAAYENGVVHRVPPQVSTGALRTVRGTIKVRVRVTVDSAGNVTKARIESGGSSRYFAQSALGAAREWKFAPAQSGERDFREWNLQFTFNRKKMDASATRGKR